MLVVSRNRYRLVTEVVDHGFIENLFCVGASTGCELTTYQPYALWFIHCATDPLMTMVLFLVFVKASQINIY